MKHRYTCERCKRVFESERSDAEAAAEYAQTFGPGQPAGAVVCDPCYQKMMDWATNTPEGRAVLAATLKDGGA